MRRGEGKTGRARRATGTPAHQRLAPPAALVARRIRLGDDDFAILEWPLSASPVPRQLPRALSHVLQLVLRGLSNTEIARRRGTSVRTVANQVGCLLRTFEAASRHDLMARVLAGGDGPRGGSP